jgi:hypothetical protein
MIVVLLLVLAGLVVGSLALWIFYWVMRAAVRHGIEDAWRRRAAQAAEDAVGWDPARR